MLLLANAGSSESLCQRRPEEIFAQVYKEYRLYHLQLSQCQPQHIFAEKIKIVVAISFFRKE